MLKQRQQLKLLQKISPQQIQFIKLLQIPTVSLETRIKEEMEVNPALEEGSQDLDNQDSENQDSENERDTDYYSDPEKNSEKEFNIEDYMQADAGSYKTRLPSGGDDDDDYETPIIQTNSFYDMIAEQLGMLELEERGLMIAEHLVGSIEDDGYLRRPLRAIVNDMAFRYNLRTDEEELEYILKKIQNFDPPGIAARDLRECLLLQLDRKEKSPDVQHAKVILRDHFEEFSKKHFKRLKSTMGLSDDELKDAYTLITRLNPKPGGAQTASKNEYIVPDFILTVEGGKIDIQLNGRNAPELKVSHNYLNLYEQYKNQQKGKKDASIKETLDFVKSKIESAQWFIDAIKQRQYTLLNTMYAIAEKQSEFFISGGDEKKLRPMILKDIADEIEMDISTISRVANSKYVQTDFGIFPLKYFFTEGISTEGGEEVSNREVKGILQEMVDNENKRKPISDDKLSEMLQKRGYNIARRTVAKYRDQLNIPVARLRKEV